MCTKRLYGKHFSVFCFILLLPFVTSTSMAGAEESVALPKSMIWSGYDVGSTGYVQASAIADGFLKKWKTQIRIIPSGTSIGRITPLTARKAVCAFLSNEVYSSVEGIDDFASYEWGPQDLRVILAHPNGNGCATTKESGIKTPKDLKGKRVIWIPGTPSVNVKNEAYLAFAGLTWNDVVKVEVPNYRESQRALIDGRADATAIAPNTPMMYELENSPRGLQWVHFDPEDKEGWKRLQKVAPYLYPKWVKIGAGIDPNHPQPLLGFRYPMITVYADADPGLVYNLVKAVHLSFPLYEKSFPVMPEWRIEDSGVPPADAPFHDAAVKYLKEQGVWKQNYDEWNSKRISHIKKLQSAWEDTLQTAQENKIKSKDFADFWLKEREKALGQ